MRTTSQPFPGDPAADFDVLRRQVERLFGLRGTSVAPIGSNARGSFPPVNIGSTPEAVEVFAFAPGIDAETLDVSIDKGLLTIAGERRRNTLNTESVNGVNGEEQMPASAAAAVPTVHTRERSSGSFRRVIALPEEADASRVAATYRNGVLKVRIEKRESSRARRIQVA